MCMDMLTCCRLQPQRPHLESRVPRHTEPQARCASPPHRRPTFARSCTRWGWARRRAARWPCSRASRGSTTSRTLYKPRRSLRCEADFLAFFTSISVRCVIYMRPSRQASPKPNHYVVQYCKAVLTSSSSVPPSPRPPAPTPRGPGPAPGPAVRDGPRVRNRLEFWAKTCKLKTRKLTCPSTQCISVAAWLQALYCTNT